MLGFSCTRRSLRKIAKAVSELADSARRMGGRLTAFHFSTQSPPPKTRKMNSLRAEFHIALRRFAQTNFYEKCGKETRHAGFPAARGSEGRPRARPSGDARPGLEAIALGLYLD